MLAALEVWDDYQPDTAHARDEHRRLLELLATGWETDRIVVPQAEPLFLLRREHFQVLAQHGGFRLRARSLGSSPRCDTEPPRDLLPRRRAGPCAGTVLISVDRTGRVFVQPRPQLHAELLDQLDSPMCSA